MLRELYGALDTLCVFALGVQRTGSTSLGSALHKVGFQVAHNRPKWIQDADHAAVYLTRAHAKGVDPVAQMPGVGAVVHPSICVLNPEPLNLWPQMDLSLLESVRNHHPNCLFVLNKRPLENWVRSVTHWKDFRERLTAADIPGLPPGVGINDSELIEWMSWHHERMRDLFRNSSCFVEIDIENSEEAESILSSSLGLDIKWPWLNHGTYP